MLTWAGLKPDEGPTIGGQYGPYIQSERMKLYQDMVQVLLQNGSAYHCFCSPKRLELLRKEAARRGEVHKYDNKCRHLSGSEVEEKLSNQTPSVVRFKLDHYTESWEDLVYGPITYDVASIEGDPILLKSDGFPTYHLANVVDDHHMEISHILRGEEWQASTTKHILLYKAFGWAPPKFAHLPLMLNRDGTKLSKRQGDIHVECFKDKGYYPEAVLNFITYLGGGFPHSGLQVGGFTLQELVDKFSLSSLSTHSAKIDVEMIDVYNRQHLVRLLQSETTRRALIEETRHLVRETFAHKMLENIDLQNYTLSNEYIGKVLHWAVVRIHRLQELVETQFEFVWVIPSRDITQALQYLHSNPEIILQTISLVEAMDDFSSFQLITKQLKKLAKTEDVKFSTFMKYLRKALSGLDEGPSVAEMICLLGQESTVLRLRHTYELLTQS
ncbi:nondiscriminating glutamyl-tRNA synthetase EARS2, mitochondrial-like isoform X2 [Liolophura sinensis]